MKHYLINDFIYKGEYKLVFFETLKEDEYRLYMYAKLHLRKAKYNNIHLPNIDFLQFEPIEISDIEYSILDNIEPRGTYYPTSYLYCYLSDKADELGIKLPENWSDITDKQLMEIIDELSN